MPLPSGLVDVVDEGVPKADTLVLMRGGRHATTNPSTPMKDRLPNSHAMFDPSDVTPTPGKAARHLARFVEKVQVERALPLLVVPLGWMVATTRSILVRGRSRRIAA